MAATTIGRALWLQERRRGIGGSDAAAILGLDRYATPYDVWMDKRGEAPEVAETPAMWWGRELEGLIARRYTETTGRDVWQPGGIMVHPDLPHLIGTPDRIVVGNSRGLEIKTVGQYAASEWGRAGTDEVPRAYLAQVLHYMAVTALPLWDVAALFGVNDMRVYTVHRDADYEAAVIPRLSDWWQRHVVEGHRPDITGASSTSDLLAARWPASDGKMLPATHEAKVWAARYTAAKAAVAVHQQDADTAANNLKEIIQDADGIGGDGWRCTWRAAKASRATDWQRVADRLAEDIISVTGDKGLASVQRYIHQHTVVAPGTRRFLVRMDGDK